MAQQGRPRPEAEIERDQRRIADLYLKGWKLYQIAEKLDLSAPTVRSDLMVIEERWMVESVTAIAKAKAQELAKLNLLEIEYWKGWERSNEDAIVEVTETIDKEGEVTSKTKFQRRGQAGDPRFLDGINRVVMDRCKILGITLDITLNIDLNILPLEFLERIVAGESEIDVFADWQRLQGRDAGGVLDTAFVPDALPEFVKSYKEAASNDVSEPKPEED